MNEIEKVLSKHIEDAGFEDAQAFLEDIQRNSWCEEFVEEARGYYGSLENMDWDRELDFSVVPYHALEYLSRIINRYSNLSELSKAERKRWDNAISLVEENADEFLSH